MTTIFLAQTPASAAFAEQLRRELGTKGYTVAEYPPLEAASASGLIERAIIGSAAVVLLWETSAASPEWEALHIATAQRFHKPIFPLLLDATPPPASLAALATLSGQLPPAQTVAALVSLPDFPTSHASDPLLALYAEATGVNIKLRRAAIGKAAEMLDHNQHRDELLNLLNYLAEHDQLNTLRKVAGEALLHDAERHKPRPPFSPVEAAMMVSGQCEAGHQSFYNKRYICQQDRPIVYAPQDTQHHQDELVVRCQTEGCSRPVVVYVDCGAYR